MPETALGLFPDVGASYFLSRLPGFFGNGNYIIDPHSNSLDTKSLLKNGWSSFFFSSLLDFGWYISLALKFSWVVQFLFVGLKVYDWPILLQTSSIGESIICACYHDMGQVTDRGA